MRLTKFISILTIFLSVTLISSCEDILEEENRSQLASENLLTTKLGIQTVIAGAYSNMNFGLNNRNIVKREEMTSDILWQTGGGENGTAVSLIGFLWDPNNSLEAFTWDTYWNAIRDCNTVLDNLEGVSDISDAEKSQITAEMRFVRAWAYEYLWNQFGAMPIRTSLVDEPQKARATEEEFSAFMESEILAAIPDLPEPGDEPNYGRVHSDGARGLLCKWYLNTKQWQKCADMAQEIIARGNFELFPSIFDLFALENERNNEFMLVHTGLANQRNFLNLIPTSLPPGYLVGLDGGMENQVNVTWRNFASQYRLLDEFFNSFESNDDRKTRILTRYINGTGDTINLLNNNNNRGMKFPPDPECQGPDHGNDYPSVRYADILLSRAEALNELNGPNQVSIDLINQIRNRAQLDDIALADFSTKEALRDHILDERRWEFWYEGKRRRDLLRMDKYIEFAIERGHPAQDKHKLFPIPQTEVDANSQMVQNPGY